MFTSTLMVSMGILLGAPIVVFLLGKWNDKAAKWSAFILTLTAAVFFALTLGDVLATGEHVFAGWDWISFSIGGKSVDIGFSLVADNLSFVMAAIIFILF